MDGNLTSTIMLYKSGPGSNGNKEVIHSHRSCMQTTGCSLMTYPWHSAFLVGLECSMHYSSSFAFFSLNKMLLYLRRFYNFDRTSPTEPLEMISRVLQLCARFNQYLTKAWGRTFRFMPFPRGLVQFKTQTTLTRIWTQVIDSISFNDNRNVTRASFMMSIYGLIVEFTRTEWEL